MSEPLFTLFGLSVTKYALCVFASATAGALLFFYRSAKRSIAARASELFVIFAIPLSVLLGHLMYYLTSISQMLDASEDYSALFLLSPLSGGFLFFGVFLGIALAALAAGKITRTKPSRILDAVCPALFLLIALCRLSEPFDVVGGMGQGWGLQTESENLCFFPLAFMPNAEYEEWYYSIFLLEGLYALLMCILTALDKKNRPDGQLLLLCIILYCASQVLFETLRRDEVVKWLFVRVSQLMSVISLALVLLYGTIKNGSQNRKKYVLFWTAFILLTGLCIAIEFTVDKPIPIGDELYFLPYWLTYSIIGLSAAGMGAISWHAAKQI